MLTIDGWVGVVAEKAGGVGTPGFMPPRTALGANRYDTSTVGHFTKSHSINEAVAGL